MRWWLRAVVPLVLGAAAAAAAAAGSHSRLPACSPWPSGAPLGARPFAGSFRNLTANTTLRVDGRFFRTPDGRRFAWRGITAFRLLEMVAGGRERDADAVLRWAAARGVTIVRVLAMADRLFHLAPADGLRALPRLLQAARAEGLQVEVVALADTDRIPVDLAEQVRAVGRICAREGGCVVEVANEPWAGHAQRRGLGDAALLRSLRSLVPAAVPVSLGSSSDDTSDEYSAGDYITVHVARAEGDEGWRSVVRTGVAGKLGATAGKPVVDDEPIGAAARGEPGRRDADPARWFVRGLLARVLGIGTTFHYEGGLQGKVPEGQELACFQAWRAGLDALPPDIEERTRFIEAGSPGSAVASFDRDRALAVFVAQGEAEAWAAAITRRGEPGLVPASGWRILTAQKYTGIELVHLASARPRN